MFPCLPLEQLEAYFTKSSQRMQQGVYFYRIINYSTAVDSFLVRYFQEARQYGVVLEGKLANPTGQNLAYYREMLGDLFILQPAFFQQQLSKWLPRLERSRQQIVANAIFDVLQEMARSGKNENMLKNAYIKFMCWMYYRFERVLHLLGNETVPKILYEGSVRYYELEMLRILSAAGCDIVLLDVQGDQAYRKLDPDSKYSRLYEQQGTVFPTDYSIREHVRQAQMLQQAVGVSGGPSGQQLPVPCINAWMADGNILEELQKPTAQRGEDKNLYYTVFARICGVEEKNSYKNTLLQLYLQLTGAGRQVLVLEQEIPLPSPEEIQKIQRKRYQKLNEMLMDLSQNIVCAAPQLQQILRQQFISFLQEEADGDDKLNRWLNRAVYLLCWLRRYQEQLFGNWQSDSLGVFLYLSPCQEETELLFLRYLSRLPLDIVIFSPNLNLNGEMKDKFLYEKKYTISMNVEQYPTEGAIQLGTVAYHAEQELTETLYQDSGLYREQQYDKAKAVALQTMYEEIFILWEQQEAYRPNFDVVQDEVIMPVLFAKVSGVKNGEVSDYWRDIKKLLVKDTLLYNQVPMIHPTDENPVKQYSTEFFRNGTLQRQKLKQHKAYSYQYLREEMQDYMLDKVQQLIDWKLIQGTFQNGTEYTIVSTLLNLEKNIVRLIQKMDFTKLAPKLVLINTGEAVYSLEDSIVIAYLHLLGFDIVLFVPTGYRSLEQYYTQPILTEHVIGEYLYDLTVPANLRDAVSKRGRPSLRELLLGRGR